MRRALILALAPGGAAACVYFNAMWSAEHFAAAARKAEARGRAEEARSWWARAAEKAESVVARHPTSRWAEEALVLQAEGLARSGTCERAAAPLARALRTVSDATRRERAALVAAECALKAGDPGAADRRLAEVTASRDAARRSRAAFLAGRAAQLEGDYGAAAKWYRRSADPGAGAARARVLLAAGRIAEANALVDTLTGGPFRGRERDWAELLDALAQAATPEAASGALDRLVARRRVPAGARARLLIADGDRLLAAGRADAAGARYAAAAALVPDSLEGQQARVRQMRARAARADSLEELVAVHGELSRLTRDGTVSAATGEARALEALLRRALDPEDLDEGTEFRIAETLADSLGASRLAARLFLEFARRRPASIFAPKAILAAAALLPDAHDSLITVLNARYPTSPYTLALRGDPSPAFAAAEDSLARALGLDIGAQLGAVARAPLERFFGSRVAPPVPGPRGPPLDPPAPVALGAPPAPTPARLRAPRGEPRRPGARDRDDEPVRRSPRPAPSPEPRDTL